MFSPPSDGNDRRSDCGMLVLSSIEVRCPRRNDRGDFNLTDVTSFEFDPRAGVRFFKVYRMVWIGSERMSVLVMNCSVPWARPRHAGYAHNEQRRLVKLV